MRRVKLRITEFYTGKSLLVTPKQVIDNWKLIQISAPYVADLMLKASERAMLNLFGENPPKLVLPEPAEGYGYQLVVEADNHCQLLRCTYSEIEYNPTLLNANSVRPLFCNLVQAYGDRMPIQLAAVA